MERLHGRPLVRMKLCRGHVEYAEHAHHEVIKRDSYMQITKQAIIHVKEIRVHPLSIYEHKLRGQSGIWPNSAEGDPNPFLS